MLARIPESELADLMRGYGYEPHFVTGDDPMTVHALLAATLDTVLDDIAAFQLEARSGVTAERVRPHWPMIVLRTPKGLDRPQDPAPAQQTSHAGRRLRLADP